MRKQMEISTDDVSKISTLCVITVSSSTVCLPAGVVSVGCECEWRGEGE